MITDLEKLAEICLDNARILKAALAENDAPQPTFSLDSPPAWPELGAKAAQARLAVRNASKELYELSTGPAEMVSNALYPSVRAEYLGSDTVTDGRCRSWISTHIDMSARTK